jgi:3-oxoacyl-[acyl-carrier-protein] synthase-3
MTVNRTKLIGFGHYLPSKVLTNDDMSKIVDTNDEWITDRTGIKKRAIAAEGEFTSDLAYKAALEAIENANISADDIDLVVVATATPDNSFPSVATKVAYKLGVKKGAPAFDLSAACSGFVYGLNIVDTMIKTGQSKTALIIGAETLSRIVDWEDRNTCVLFGDGAGAVIVTVNESEDDTSSILATKLFANGELYDQLYTTGGVSTSRNAGCIKMNGREVFKNAVTYLPNGVKEVAEIANIKIDEIDWLIPHQANIRIIDGTGKKLGIDSEKVIVTVQDHANTSAASIPLALSENIRSGKIKKGDLLALTAFGAGFTWGASVIRL